MDDLERELGKRLRQAPAVEVPAAIDAAVLLEARRRLGRRRPRWVPYVAAAAAAAVVTLLVWPTPREQRAARPDIVDAYLLALQLEAGDPVDERWDLDGDGRVGRADVDRLLDGVVELQRRGS